ncbi:MAG: HindIII family type II restriction endonuclease [Candidatus Colwellbacteria bacterium]|nr:HindIII family type II restriction endonuclease [Candidatus Colwellbacteria bacterium]
MRKTFREQVIDDIFRFSDKDNSFEMIEKKCQSINKETLIAELIQVGIMPEVFEHDSSEEKLWSKFSDIILSKSLDILGLKSEVLRTRGNSADVYSRAKNYTLVSDAKCFRLSRTAKNQKDFKVKALDDWRRQDTYALLVSPLAQYPADKSQIYPQAFAQNVTLLSYLHLQFLIEKGVRGNLEDLWKLPVFISKNYKKEDQKRGNTYWHAVDAIVSKITEQPVEVMRRYKQREIKVTKKVGQEGIDYWETKIKEFTKLTREQAVTLLIKAQKIEQKIETIKKAIEKTYEHKEI